MVEVFRVIYTKQAFTSEWHELNIITQAQGLCVGFPTVFGPNITPCFACSVTLPSLSNAHAIAH